MRVSSKGALDQLYSRPFSWPPGKRKCYWKFYWLQLHLRNLIVGIPIVLMFIYWASRGGGFWWDSSLVTGVCTVITVSLLENTHFGSLWDVKCTQEPCASCSFNHIITWFACAFKVTNLIPVQSCVPLTANQYFPTNRLLCCFSFFQASIKKKKKKNDAPGCRALHGGGLHEKPDVPSEAVCKTSLM